MQRQFVFALVLGLLLLGGCCGPIGPGENEVKLHVECDEFEIVSPSYEFYKSMNDLPSFSCDVRNDGMESVTVLVSSQITGYSSEFEQTLVLASGATKTVNIQYSFEDEFYDLNDATSALLKTSFEVGGEVVRSDSENVQIEKSSVFSPDLGDEGLIAMWVTYNDPCIEEIISEAKKFAPGQQFMGYLGDYSTMKQELAAVFYALYYQDIKYVSSTFTSTKVESAFYEQDIRFPYRSLTYKQMNCIDGAVLYSAILEKLDYETGVALIPGHAFVVVWDPFYETWIPIETTVTGDEVSTFDDAVAYGMESMMDPELQIVNVHEAIQQGISPMPTGTHECEIEKLDEIAEVYRELTAGSCMDPDYGFMGNGECSYDSLAICLEGIVYWAEEGECGGSVGSGDCTDPDYGYIWNGQCSYDELAICIDGIVYWAEEGDCEGTSRNSYGDCYDTDYGDLGNGECTNDGIYVCIDGEMYIADAYPCPGHIDLSCEDPDYGHMENNECSPDGLAICLDGLVWWATAEECPPENPGDCWDPDYGIMENGECSQDDLAICIDGLVYWAIEGDC
jgi:hypothetical protein